MAETPIASRISIEKKELSLDQKDDDCDTIRFCKVILKHNRWREAVKSELRKELRQVIFGEVLVAMVMSYEAMVLFISATNDRISFMDVDNGEIHTIPITKHHYWVKYFPFQAGFGAPHGHEQVRLLIPPETHRRAYMPTVGALVETRQIADLQRKHFRDVQFRGDEEQAIQNEWANVPSDWGHRPLFLDFPVCKVNKKSPLDSNENRFRRIHFRFSLACEQLQNPSANALDGSEWFSLSGFDVEKAYMRKGVQPLTLLVGDTCIDNLNVQFRISEILFRPPAAGQELVVQTSLRVHWWAKREFQGATLFPYQHGFLGVSNGRKRIKYADLLHTREIMYIEGQTVFASNPTGGIDPPVFIHEGEHANLTNYFHSVVTSIESTSFFVSIWGSVLQVDAVNATLPCRVIEVKQLKFNVPQYTFSMHVIP